VRTDVWADLDPEMAKQSFDAHVAKIHGLLSPQKHYYSLGAKEEAGSKSIGITKAGVALLVYGFALIFDEPEIVECVVDHNGAIGKSAAYENVPGRDRPDGDGWRKSNKADGGWYREVVEDYFIPVVVRYRVKVKVLREGTGEVVGIGWGIATSSEKRYKGQELDSVSNICSQAIKRAKSEALTAALWLDSVFEDERFQKEDTNIRGSGVGGRGSGNGSAKKGWAAFHRDLGATAEDVAWVIETAKTRGEKFLDWCSAFQDKVPGGDWPAFVRFIEGGSAEQVAEKPKAKVSGSAEGGMNPAPSAPSVLKWSEFTKKFDVPAGEVRKFEQVCSKNKLRYIDLCRDYQLSDPTGTWDGFCEYLDRVLNTTGGAA